MKRKVITRVLTIYSIVFGLFLFLDSVTHYHSEEFIFLIFLSLILMGLGIAGLLLNVQERFSIIKYFVIPIFIIQIFLFHNSGIINAYLLQNQFSSEFLLLTPIVFSVFYFLPEKDAGNNEDDFTSNSLKSKKQKIRELQKLRDDGLLTDEELETAVNRTLEE